MCSRGAVTCCFWLAALLLMPGCRDREKWIVNYGYNPIRPPSTLLMPGTMLMKQPGANTGARMLCSAQDSLGASWRAGRSDTLSGKFSKTRKAGWRISADVLSQAKAAANAEDVDEVFVTIQNAQIVHLTDAEIYKTLANRTEQCRRAIAARRAAGYQISMVKSALVGDVQYQVKFSAESQLDAEAKIAQVANLAVNLGGNLSAVTETTAGATGLIWGIQEDMFLAALSFDDASERSVKRASRMLPSDYVVDVPDALAPPTPMSEGGPRAD